MPRLLKRPVKVPYAKELYFERTPAPKVFEKYQNFMKQIEDTTIDFLTSNSLKSTMFTVLYEGGEEPQQWWFFVSNHRPITIKWMMRDGNAEWPTAQVEKFVASLSSKDVVRLVTRTAESLKVLRDKNKKREAI